MVFYEKLTPSGSWQSPTDEETGLHSWSASIDWKHDLRSRPYIRLSSWSNIDGVDIQSMDGILHESYKNQHFFL